MIEALTFLIFGIGMLFLGILLFPFIMFLRARRDDSWDDSNMTNMFRLIGHMSAHPSDFGKMRFEDGTRPFWYISKDEFTEVVKTRPKD